jgi:hypothetical protein
MKLSHFSPEKFIDKVESRKQRSDNDYHSAHEKPLGLWVSVDGEYCWDTWCRENDFNRGIYRHRVILSDTAKILYITTAEELVTFRDTYARHEPRTRFQRDKYIAWADVAKEYQGIIISPYIWEKRLSEMWYYGWDCASGCIWSSDAVSKIEPDHSLFKGDEP